MIQKLPSEVTYSPFFIKKYNIKAAVRNRIFSPNIGLGDTEASKGCSAVISIGVIFWF